MNDDKTHKPKVPGNADDKEQSERFIETARQHAVDETSGALDRAFKKLTKSDSKRDAKRTPASKS